MTGNKAPVYKNSLEYRRSSVMWVQQLLDTRLQSPSRSLCSFPILALAEGVTEQIRQIVLKTKRAKSLHTRVLKLEWSHQNHVIDYFKAQIYFSYDKKFQHAAKVKLIPCWSLRLASIWSLVAALASTRCRTTSGARQDWIMASQVSQPRLASHRADFIRALEHFMITSVVEPTWLPSPSHESQSVQNREARKICQGNAVSGEGEKHQPAFQLVLHSC